MVPLYSLSRMQNLLKLDLGRFGAKEEVSLPHDVIAEPNHRAHSIDDAS